MASTGGNSLSYWRLLNQLRNYLRLSKFLTFQSSESIKNKVAGILRLYSKDELVAIEKNLSVPKVTKDKNVEKEEKSIAEKLSSISPVPAAESKISYAELRRTLNVLNDYLPQIPFVNSTTKDIEHSKSKESATNPIPKWRLEKREINPLISKSSIDARVRHLVGGIDPFLTDSINLRRIEELCHHLKTFPTSKGAAVKCSGLSKLLNVLHKSKEPSLQTMVREALALMGYNYPVSGHGIKILSIDGGGTRGLVALEILHHIELRTGKPIHELFDFICGVSTGAIIAVLIGAHRLPLSGVIELYRNISNKVFSQTTFKGTASLMWNNSYYNSDAWTEILRENMGNTHMIETARDPNVTKLCLVSTQANANWIKAFLFRNYNLSYRSVSHFNGTSSCKLWESVRASAAAPGYFSEFRLDDLILLDGGIMVNNPTSIAIHEAHQIWPDTPLQSVVSIGTGRHEPLALAVDKSVNWTLRFKTILNSATDTEGVHTTLHDLLPGNVYFRLNPYLSEEIMLDEIREEKLSTMIEDTRLYLRKNEVKIGEAVASLTKPKTLLDRLADEVNQKILLWNL